MAPDHPQLLRDCVTCELRSVRMFCNLDDAAFADFQLMGTQRSLTRGDRLFQEAEPSCSIFLICTGQVKLTCSSKHGKTLILKIAMPGDLLGLGAVFSGSRYEVSAQAIGPTSVKEIEQELFLEFLQKHGQASLHAAKSLAQEYKAAFFEARRLALSGSTPSRLAGLLLDWGRLASCGKPEMRFTMALTHEELADMVGSSRETVTRILARFRREGLIASRGSSILIQAPKRLEELSV